MLKEIWKLYRRFLQFSLHLLVSGLISVLRPFNTFWVILGAVSYPNHTVPGQVSKAVYQYLVHIISPVTDNCSSWTYMPDPPPEEKSHSISANLMVLRRGMPIPQVLKKLIFLLSSTFGSFWDLAGKNKPILWGGDTIWVAWHVSKWTPSQVSFC